MRIFRGITELIEWPSLKIFGGYGLYIGLFNNSEKRHQPGTNKLVISLPLFVCCGRGCICKAIGCLIASVVCIYCFYNDFNKTEFSAINRLMVLFGSAMALEINSTIPYNNDVLNVWLPSIFYLFSENLIKLKSSSLFAKRKAVR